MAIDVMTRDEVTVPGGADTVEVAAFALYV
jgi:hypothetical protein